MPRIVKFSKNIKLDNVYVIAAWPGMGQVAHAAVQYLITKLGAEEFCSLDAGKYFYPAGVQINKGMAQIISIPENKFYYWQDKNKKTELIFFLCSSQPDLAQSIEYSNLILDVCQKTAKRIRSIITFAALPTTIEHVQKPQVFAASTSKMYLQRLKLLGLEAITKAQISGMNGLFLGVAKQRGIEGIAMLAQIPLYTIQIDNPQASVEILEKFSKLVNIKIDLVKLYQDAQQAEIQVNTFLDYLKESFHHTEEQPISQDELERIKHMLSEYTKLPNSAKAQIEKLFEDARRDISKAKELKTELDKWNIYSEYEDRFLDLFKKKEESN